MHSGDWGDIVGDSDATYCKTGRLNDDSDDNGDDGDSDVHRGDDNDFDSNDGDKDKGAECFDGCSAVSAVVISVDVGVAHNGMLILTRLTMMIRVAMTRMTSFRC